ncbi:methylamine utilization protein MauJ [Sulfitobacter sp. HGT1]|uniref:methylamine utilization protein MauJ n=1 Tax=Sulfitobacter sp. HGT1 TaxID=2735435 RepID=UPI001593D8BE|nr:methylamine utilization protein MauJ [Sulfitobacter sp. HGT1]
MYAKNLSLLLHRELSEPRSFDETLTRFQSLRGYGQLPRGRERAAQRLTNDEIARAVLGYVPTQSGWAGHVALIMADLRPVGGVSASLRKARSLSDAMAALLDKEQDPKAFVSLTLSIARIPGNDEYQAKLIFEEDGLRRTASYVSKNALTLAVLGAESTFDHDRPLSSNSRQLVLDREFFSNLKRDVDLSRALDRPLKTDWREYETEEEREIFDKSLGARRGSRFLNLGVDTTVAWPKDPTRVEFDGHHFVLFPKTKENSHSISIDLHHERITAEDARTLLNRFLSLLSWCDDRHAILREGWSGNPVPVPVPRRDMAFSTMIYWMFNRSMPDDDALLNCLSYYREGLNAAEAGIASQEVLSFFKVFESGFKDSGRREIGPKTQEWIASVFDEACKKVDPSYLKQFHENRQGKALAKYVYEDCRVAAAHASKNFPSDSDMSIETSRLSVAAEIIRALARHYIQMTFNFSESYFSDQPR